MYCIWTLIEIENLARENVHVLAMFLLYTISTLRNIHNCFYKIERKLDWFQKNSIQFLTKQIIVHNKLAYIQNLSLKQNQTNNTHFMLIRWKIHVTKNHELISRFNRNVPRDKNHYLISI